MDTDVQINLFTVPILVKNHQNWEFKEITVVLTDMIKGFRKEKIRLKRDFTVYGFQSTSFRGGI